MASMQRVPLVLTVVVIALRIILEESGAAADLTVIFGVTWLFFLVPIYFALKISGDHPFKSLFKQVLIFAFIARLLIMLSYVLAYQFSWSAERFGTVVGVDSGLQVLLALLSGLLFGTIIAAIIGMIIGSITLAIRRRSA